ncbi:MAG: hypothetical protein IJ733_13655 [Lachnospiraceae bacterium]|nr:hypothetical protein [Lachnospiraceae bacterium]
MPYPALKWLACHENQLTSLDVSNNPNLQSLSYDWEKVSVTGWNRDK